MREIINKITKEIEKLLEEKPFVIVSIDGRCCAGKTTLAKLLGEKLPSNILHMDDFFLRPEQRTEDRLKIPGGNVDYERFFEEVLINVCNNNAYSYRPYDCKTQSLKKPVDILPQPVTIIEGSYSCHPMLREYYDYIIFINTDPKTQMDRVIKRNGRESAKIFKHKWIPMEELYFKTYPINPDIYFTNNDE